MGDYRRQAYVLAMSWRTPTLQPTDHRWYSHFPPQALTISMNPVTGELSLTRERVAVYYFTFSMRSGLRKTTAKSSNTVTAGRSLLFRIWALDLSLLRWTARQLSLSLRDEYGGHSGRVTPEPFPNSVDKPARVSCCTQMRELSGNCRSLPCSPNLSILFSETKGFLRTPINYQVTTWKSLYTNITILKHGFFYYLDITRA